VTAIKATFQQSLTDFWYELSSNRYPSKFFPDIAFHTGEIKDKEGGCM